jgi:hypothetical protein
MGCFTSFQRTSVALVALSLLVLQASGEEGMYLMYVCMGRVPTSFLQSSFFNSFYGFLQDLDRSAGSVLSLICVSKMDGGRDRKF